MVKSTAIGVLLATAGFLGGGAVFAAPPKPLIVIFTPDVTSDVSNMKAREKVEIARTQDAALALRERFTDSGFVDAVVYSPDNALFVRAMLEAKIRPGDPLLPTASERYAIAKAAGAAYGGYVSTHDPTDKTETAVDVQLETEQIDGRKTWKDRRTMSSPGGVVSLQETPRFSNALLSTTNTLVQDFLNGPLHELSQATAPSLPPPQIPVIKNTPKPDEVVNPVVTPNTPTTTPTTPNLVEPAPLRAGVPKVAPVKPTDALPSSGADTDGAAEAEKRQGDEMMRAGDSSGAILSFRKAVNLAPRNAGYRTALAKAYLDAGRKGDALSEAKRALSIVPAEDPKSRIVVSRLLAEILTQNGDTTAARVAYEDIIRNQSSVIWARVELADLLASQGQVAEAENVYKTALKLAPTDKDAHLGYAKLLATKGDYDGALREITAASGSEDAEGRYNTAVGLFDDGVNQIVNRVEQNRTAWESKQISQEVYYKATSSQTAKVSGLVALLKAVPPPATGGDAMKQKHNKRVLAASLLLQGVASLLTQVETSDADAGSQATVFLSEFKRTMSDVDSSEKETTP